MGLISYRAYKNSLTSCIRRRILIPLPIGNGEQAANAADLQIAGAAEVVDDNKFNADWLISNWDQIWHKASNYQPSVRGEFSASQIIGQAIITRVGSGK